MFWSESGKMWIPEQCSSRSSWPGLSCASWQAAIWAWWTQSPPGTTAVPQIPAKRWDWCWSVNSCRRPHSHRSIHVGPSSTRHDICFSNDPAPSFAYHPYSSFYAKQDRSPHSHARPRQQQQYKRGINNNSSACQTRSFRLDSFNIMLYIYAHTQSFSEKKKKILKGTSSSCLRFRVFCCGCCSRFLMDFWIDTP